MISEKGKLILNDLISLGKTAGILLLSTLIAWLIANIGNYQWGGYYPTVVPIVTMLLKVLQKYLENTVYAK